MGLIKRIKNNIEEAKSDEIEVSDIETVDDYSIFDRYAMPFERVVAPESALVKPDYFKIGGQYTRTLYINSYPPNVFPDWLREIAAFRGALDYSIYINPIPIKELLKQLKQQAYRDHALIDQKNEKGLQPDQHQVMQLEDTYNLIRDLEQNNSKPFDVMVVMTLRAKTLEELDSMTEALQTQINTLDLRRAELRHKQGFLTNLPLLTNKMKAASLSANRALNTQSLRALFPFAAGDFTHDQGVMIGVSAKYGTPIIYNRFQQPELENPNMAVFGKPGSGKSFFSKIEITRFVYHGTPVVVIDPSGEYNSLCEGLGGTRIDISLQSEHNINPLDFSASVRPGHNALRDKISFIVEMVGMMTRDEGRSLDSMDRVTKQYFENALDQTYKRFGYDPADIETQLTATPENMPLFSNVWTTLERLAQGNTHPDAQRRYNDLLVALSPYVNQGQFAPLFDRHTNVTINSHFVNFDYQNLSPAYRTLGMYLVLEYLRTLYLTHDHAVGGVYRSIYLDEAHLLMEHPEIASFLEQTFRASRKYGVGMTVMTQNVGVFAHGEGGGENKAGRGILASCATIVLLGQASTEARPVAEEFDLRENEIQALMTAGYGEGLLRVGNEAAWFTSVGMTSDLETQLLSTTPAERAQFERQKKAMQLEAQTAEAQVKQIPAVSEPYRPPAALNPGQQQPQQPSVPPYAGGQHPSNPYQSQQQAPQFPNQQPESVPLEEEAEVAEFDDWLNE